jgi:transcriptional regulator
MELLRGTLDLLILAMLRDGPLHGYGIASAIRRSTRSMLAVQDGVLYPTLKKLEARGILKAAWGITESGREARYYELTAKGRKRLAAAEEDWKSYVRAMALALRSV